MKISFFSAGLLGAVFLIATILPAEAKRVAPKLVEPVVIDYVRYTAPNEPDQIGEVVASDVGSGREIWRKRIYRIFVNPFMEEDIQWVFITSLVQRNHMLIVTNERGKRFTLDPKTRRVTKGK